MKRRNTLPGTSLYYVSVRSTCQASLSRSLTFNPTTDPEDKTLFKVIGRVDDQIMLSTGEKVSQPFCS